MKLSAPVLLALVNLAIAGETPDCQSKLPARVDWTEECISELNVHASTPVDLWQAGSTMIQVCGRYNISTVPPGHQSTTSITVGKIHDSTTHTTFGDIACGAQAVLDACTVERGLVGGTGQVCGDGEKDFIVVVQGAGNK